MGKYIFGYGSLINLESLEKTIRRSVTQTETIPSILNNYQRIWNLKESIFADVLDRTVCGIFLNIELASSKKVNGVIIEVSDNEFDALRKRERNYDVVDVTLLIESPALKHAISKAIFTFVANDPRFIQNGYNSDCFVMRRYIKMIKEGCTAINETFWENFKESTVSHEFPELDGTYKFI